MTGVSTHTLQYGTTTIEYDLSYASRKTLAIEVHPDLRVAVQAPVGADLADIEAKIKKRAPWILRQQRRFETYLPKLPPRQSVSGETHRYLGRQYRLKLLENGAAESVKLARGYFYITLPDRTDAERVRSLLDDWYRCRADSIFKERLDSCFARLRFLDLDYPDLTIRQMKNRWGSCTPDGKIILNLTLIQVPKVYIDYVIMHELCHLKEHNHSRRFYDLLDRAMPDWQSKRAKLNTFEVS